MTKFRFAIFTFLIASLLSIAAPVFAHANLLKSTPEANATLQRQPVQVELFFSEPLDPTFSSITILNTDGVAVDSNDSRVDANDPTRLTVSLRSISDGVYTVSWKALSSADGHLTTGSFPFAVGNIDPAALAAADQASKSIRFSFDEAVARWLLFLAATALTGGALFKIAVWRDLESSLSNLSINWKLLSLISLLVLTVANILGLISQAGQAANTGFAFPWEKSFTGVLFNTRFGALWIARAALTFVLARFAFTEMVIPRSVKRDEESLGQHQRFLASLGMTSPQWLVLLVSLFLLLTISLGSHAAADTDPTLTIANDVLHLIAASVWIGGVIHFAYGLWTLKKVEGATTYIAKLLPRFSALALISVGTLTLTGLYASVIRIGTFDALNASIYGRTLIVKLIIALPMIVMGAINLLVITPEMKKRVDLSNLFTKIVTSESALGIVLLLSVGVLTSLPPAQTTSSLPSLAAQQNVDDINMAIEITPGKIGQNTFTVKVTAGGVPVVNAQEVRLQFTSMSGKVPSSKVQLAHQGNGVYSIKGTYLSLPDAWQVQVVTRRENKFDAYANFDFNVGANTSQSFPWYQINAILLLASGLAYFWAMNTIRSRAQRIAFGVVPALALIAIGASVYYAPPLTTRVLPINPIPPNTSSTSIGRDLYETNCVTCHGTGGKGDGAIGLTLNPRPADLTLHTAPGVHPDGQLYDWITNGFTSTAMPTFKSNLTDEQRWHLVNYIRTLAIK